MEVSKLKPNSPLPIYYMFPRFLDEMDLPETARRVYMHLLDRARLSMKTPGWTDEGGNVFVYYPIEALAHDLGKGETAMKRSLKALEEADLIRRDRQGIGKANRIYVMIPQAGNSLYDRPKTDCIMGRKGSGRKNKPDIRTYECEEWESL